MIEQFQTSLRSFVAQYGRGPLIAIGCVVAFLLVAFAFLGYSAGYGKMVDGKVDIQRTALWSQMRIDYRRDGGEWSFGYLVPIVALVVLWVRRRDFMAVPVRPSMWGGGLVLLAAFFIYWAGYRGEQKYFGYASGQILGMGLILWFLGWGWFKKGFWLWVLVGMMWPWRFLIELVSSPLQLIMVKLTSGVLGLFGVGAVTSGSAVRTDSIDPKTGEFINLDIDVACSGMRSLFALVMIGLVFVCLQRQGEWKRWVFLACVPVIAIVGNFFRMLLLYFGSLIWGTEFAIGKEHSISTFHMLAGLVVFAVALVVLTIVRGLLNGRD